MTFFLLTYLSCRRSRQSKRRRTNESDEESAGPEGSDVEMTPPRSKSASGSEADGDEVPETEREGKLGRAAGTRAKANGSCFCYMTSDLFELLPGKNPTTGKRDGQNQRQASFVGWMISWTTTLVSISALCRNCTILFRPTRSAVLMLLAVF